MTPRARPSTLALALTASLALGCGSGGGTGPAPDFSVSVGAAPATTLGTQVKFAVTLTSTGYGGVVTLAASGAPASWTVAFSSNPVALTADGSASDTVIVTIPTDGAPAPSGQALTVHATAGSLGHTASTPVTVANEYVVPIADGTGSGAHWGALDGTTIHLNAGTTLTIRNDDATAHRVHTDGTIPGFPHQAADMGTGGAYSVVVQSGGSGPSSDTFYCHDHGTGTGQVHVIVQ